MAGKKIKMLASVAAAGAVAAIIATKNLKGSTSKEAEPEENAGTSQDDDPEE